jgi:hypothetical protein
LDVLQREIDAIVTAFPELRQRRRAAVFVRAIDSPSKRRRGMSASARKAISQAQKKRWAAWRKKKGHALAS